MSVFHTPKGTELPIEDLRGKPYLLVAHRLVWFREECPEHTIETNFVTMTDTFALCRAVIKDESGRILSTAHKFEDKQGFGDFREKAETGSVGRALAMIGYGTQFCSDELDGGVVDAPLEQKRGSESAPVVAKKLHPKIQAQK